MRSGLGVGFLLMEMDIISNYMVAQEGLGLVLGLRRTLFTDGVRERVGLWILRRENRVKDNSN